MVKGEFERKVDPVTRSVVLHKLVSISREMGITMRRTSRSPVFSEANDFSCAIFDWQTRLIAQAEFIPILVIAASHACRAVAKYFEDEIFPGDIMLNNDPYLGGNHLPDITAVSPMFYNDELVFWTCNRAHHIDVGGMSPGSYSPEAFEIYQEGIQIPPVKIYERGNPRRDVIDLILRNVRIPNVQRGDLRAQVGSIMVGQRRLLDLIEKYGWATIKACNEEIMDYSEELIRDKIDKIPEGVYVGEDYMDDSHPHQDSPIKIKVTMRINGSNIIADFTGSDKQVRGIVNSPYANTCSAVYVAVMTALCIDIPVSEGCFKPLKVIAPEGTVVNPLRPAGSGIATLSPAETIIHACWKALSQAVPKQLPAGWAKVSSSVSSGMDPKTNENFSYLRTVLQGGAGAMWGVDGKNYVGTIINLGGMTVPDVEMVELQYPVTVLTHEFWQGSGGPGRWRGGLGIHWVDRINVDGRTVFYGDGKKNPAYGLFGGKPGRGNISYIISDVKKIETPTKATLFIKAGDIHDHYEGGGGGYGNPLKRDPELVKWDAINEYISIRSARGDYGVVIDTKTLQVDYQATKRLREERMRTER